MKIMKCLNSLVAITTAAATAVSSLVLPLPNFTHNNDNDDDDDDLVDHSLLEPFVLVSSSSPSSILNQFVQYSGYLNATNPELGCCGCTTTTSSSNRSNRSSSSNNRESDTICQLHYWFIIEKDDHNDDGTMSNTINTPTTTNESNDNRTTTTGSNNNDNKNNITNTKPIIVWFNGGPGGSSIIGLLQEIGPFLITSSSSNNNRTTNNNDTMRTTTDEDDKDNLEQPRIILNPYRWTKMAHLLIIENPVGVGYSYCSNHNNVPNNDYHPPPCINTDDTTAQMTLMAIRDWLYNINHHPTKKFTKLRSYIRPQSTDIYLIGESYAGVYIPTLAHAILQYNMDITTGSHNNTTNRTAIPLRGIAVGDPCTDTNAQSQSMDPLWYSHKYGLVDDAIHAAIVNNTSHNNNDSRNCQQYYEKQEYNRRINDGRKSNDSTDSYNNMDMMKQQSSHPSNNDDVNVVVSPECRLAYRKYLFSSSRGISAYKNWNYTYIDRYSLYGFVTQQQQQSINKMTELFMNHPNIRQALHIPEFVYRSDPKSYWKVHSTSDTMIYNKQYNACNHNNNIENTSIHTNIERHNHHHNNSSRNTSHILPPSSSSISMIDIYRIIIPQLPHGVLIYNGNTDPAISFEGTRAAIKQIGYNEMDGGTYRPWFYYHNRTDIEFLQMKSILYGTDHLVASPDVGVQLGGYITNYEVPPNGKSTTQHQQLSFVTVHGSGHLVPQNRPQSSYHMILKFIQQHRINGSNRHSGLQLESIRTSSSFDVGSSVLGNNHSFLQLAPLFPLNASLLALKNDTELLLETINNWTILTKSSKYTHHDEM